MNASEDDTEFLVRAACSGDGEATERLFARHREQLRQFVIREIDRRLAPRIDPSDVLQESLIEAHRLLPTYLAEHPIGFYPWLQKLTFNRLIDLHRRHILAQQRSVKREVRLRPLSDDSSQLISRSMRDPEEGLAHMLREEMASRVREAIENLPSPFREVLQMRHTERKTIAEIADLQKVEQGTVRSRYFRALELLRRIVLESDERGGG